MQNVLSASLLAVAMMAPSQVSLRGQDPIAKPDGQTTSVRVVGASDGMPRPGVMVYLRRGDSVRIDEHGYMVAEDQAIRILRHATKARTDPDGRARLEIQAPLRWWQLNIAKPHLRVGQPKRVEGEWLIEVEETAAVGVRVLDANGKPMADFPVALHADGKDLDIAITDATGRAVLGVPKDFTARAVIVPAGWVGPKHGFPSIAESLHGRRGARLTLPPHGSLRLRRVRGGIAEPGEVRAHQFADPTSYAHLNAQVHAVAKNAAGVIYPYVGLGVKLWSYPQFGGSDQIRSDGPMKDGEVRDLDVDLGAVMTLRCEGLDAVAQRRSATVRLITDKVEEKRFASRKPDGTYVIDFGRALAGDRVVRVHIDVDEYSVSQACDHSLAAKAIDLGTFTLVAHEPQLRGRVLDTEGAPVANARVVISPTDRINRGYVKMTDADGRFTSSGPVLRDDDGKVVQLFARARHGQMSTGFVRGVAGEVTLTLKPSEKPERKPIATNGSVTVHLVDQLDLSKPGNVLQLRGRFGAARRPVTRHLPTGGTEVTFSGLRADTYRLFAPAPDYGSFIVLDELVCTGEGPCTDKRLQGLDCREHLRTVKVRVVDKQSVPIAGAKIMLPGAVRVTDGTGTATIYVGRTTKTEATIESPGKRTQRREQWPDDLVVELADASAVSVQVKGLPADLPRGNLEVWLRDEVRSRFAGPRQMLKAGDAVTLALPPRGQYRLSLLVTQTRRNGSTSSTVQVGPDVIEVGGDHDLKIELTLDAAAVARLREAVKKLK